MGKGLLFSIIMILLIFPLAAFAQSEGVQEEVDIGKQIQTIIEIPYESINPLFEPTQSALSAFLINLGEGASSVIAALILLLIGSAVAFFAKKVTKLAFRKIFSIKLLKDNTDVDPEKIGDEKAEGITRLVNLFPDIFFWFVFAFFAILAIDALGFPQASEAIQAFWEYVPNIFAALLFVVGGFIFAKMAKKAIESSKSVYFGKDSGIIAPVEIIIYVITFSLAVTQLKIGQEIITILIWTISGGVMAAIAVAVGWGLRFLPSNILSLFQMKKIGLDKGAEIKFKTTEEIKGTVVESTLTHTVLKVKDEQVIIPNGWLFSNKIILLKKAGSDKK